MKLTKYILLMFFFTGAVRTMSEELANWVYDSDGNEYLDVTSKGYEIGANGIESARTSEGFTVFLCDRATKTLVSLEIEPHTDYVPIRDIIGLFKTNAEHDPKSLNLTIRSSQKGRACSTNQN